MRARSVVMSTSVCSCIRNAARVCATGVEQPLAQKLGIETLIRQRSSPPLHTHRTSCYISSDHDLAALSLFRSYVSVVLVSSWLPVHVSAWTFGLLRGGIKQFIPPRERYSLNLQAEICEIWA